MIDVAKSCLFYQSELDIPLSTLEYMQLKKEKKQIDIRPLNGLDTTDNNLLNIFILSNSMPFIITNYDNKTVDYFLEKLDFFPVSIIHGILILLGKGYRFEFPENY